MLNLGAIGNTINLEPHVKRIQKHPKINVIGKSSVGINTQLNSFHYSIPEFNRIELIERSDILIIDNSSTFPFQIIGDIIRKSKHIFLTEYIPLSLHDTQQLIKLVNEAGTVIQVHNPYYYNPVIQWMNKNFMVPGYIDVSFLDSMQSENPEILFQLMTMMIGITGITPRKIDAVSYGINQNKGSFRNIRLEFNNASVYNINFGKSFQQNEFTMKAYSAGQNIFCDLVSGELICNNQPVEFEGYSTDNEIDMFIDSIIRKTKVTCSLEDFFIVQNVIQKIDKKLSMFSL